MISPLRFIDEILRTPVAGNVLGTRRAKRQILLLSMSLVIFYGVVMGCYGGIEGDRIRQPIYSGLKVPLMLMVTFGLSLPSFYVLNLLLGLGDDFAETQRALLATQAVLSIVLASLSPFTVLWYASFTDHDSATLFNAAMFGIATVSAQWRLRRYYKPLIARNARHLWMLRLWLLIYTFVAIQMGWVLRPFLGHPNLPVSFFRPDSWGNAYVYVAEMIGHVLK
jgi:hypothetical protein